MSTPKHLGITITAWIVTLIVSTLVIGFFPKPGIVYNGMLVILFILAVVNTSGFVIRIWALVVVMACSCLVSDAPPFFRMWERFAFWVILVGAVTPMFQSNRMFMLRSNILQALLYVCCFIGIASFFCYFLGINYMENQWIDKESIQAIRINSGTFGGVTVQSMIMGPSAGIGMTYMLWLVIFKKLSKAMKVCLIAAIGMAFIVVLLSASRIAFVSTVGGMATILLMKFRGQIMKFAGVAIIIVAFLAVFYPLYSSYSKALILKQEANMKAGSMFSSREDRWEHRLAEFAENPLFGIGPCTVDTKYDTEYMANEGIIEPGSSWLSVLSMTGLCGAILFLSIIIPTTHKLYKKSVRGDQTSIVLISLLMVFYIHMIAEGYIFSAGNFLCFFVWLIIGVSVTYASLPLRKLQYADSSLKVV